MRCSFALSLVAALALQTAAAAPVSSETQSSRAVVASPSEAVDAIAHVQSASSTILEVTKTTDIPRPTPTKLGKEEKTANGWGRYSMPPPIFDPPEARPETIFQSSNTADIPHPPPIQAFRPETLSPFDGAHVHPAKTPYPPDGRDADARSSSSWPCRSIRIAGSLLLLVVGVYCTVTIAERVAFLFVRVARSRRLTASGRPPAGTIQLDEKKQRPLPVPTPREGSGIGKKSGSFSSVVFGVGGGGRSSSSSPPAKTNVV